MFIFSQTQQPTAMSQALRCSTLNSFIFLVVHKLSQTMSRAHKLKLCWMIQSQSPPFSFYSWLVFIKYQAALNWVRRTAGTCANKVTICTCSTQLAAMTRETAVKCTQNLPQRRVEEENVYQFISS
jgi:hypothetical protein